MEALLSVVANADIHVFRNRRPMSDTSCSGEYIESALDYQIWKVPWAPPSVGDVIEGKCSQDLTVEIKNAWNFTCSRHKCFDVVAFQVLIFPVRLSTLAMLVPRFVRLHKYGRFN